MNENLQSFQADSYSRSARYLGKLMQNLVKTSVRDRGFSSLYSVFFWPPIHGVIYVEDLEVVNGTCSLLQRRYSCITFRNCSNFNVIIYSFEHLLLQTPTESVVLNSVTEVGGSFHYLGLKTEAQGRLILQ